MIISEQEVNEVKKKIEQYYRNQKVILWQRCKEKQLQDKLAQIEADRNNPQFQHSLSTDLKAVSYDRVSVIGGNISASPVEREIEAIYNKLDREYTRTTMELLEVRQWIREKEEDNEKIQFFLSLLSPEYRKALELKYQDHRGTVSIALELNIAQSTVYKYLNDIYLELARFIAYYGENETAI